MVVAELHDPAVKTPLRSEGAPPPGNGLGPAEQTNAVFDA
jgi:hypothetical protein